MTNKIEKKSRRIEGETGGRSLLDNKHVTILISVILAVLVWVIVTVFILQNTSTTIGDVPVNFKYDATKYTGQGLEIVNQPEYKVRLEVSGKGYEVGALDASDFVVYPDYTSVKGAGAMELKLKVRLVDSQLSNSVQAVVNDRDAKVEVVFDAVTEKSFPITPEYTDLHLADGFTLNKIVAAPAEVTVRGPQSEVEQIEKAVVNVEVGSEELRDSRLVQAKVELQNANGEPLQLDYTTIDNDIADVTLSIYQTAELPLRVDFVGVPSTFDLSGLRYSLSQKTLKVKGPAKDLANLSELTVATFDLSDFAMGKDYQLPITLPKNITAMENLSQITLSFDTDGLAEKTLNLPLESIKTINMPGNYDVRIETSRLYNVTLVGPAAELEKLSANNVVAQINAEDFQVTTGRDNVPVEIVIPSAPNVFAAGKYTVQCNITME